MQTSDRMGVRGGWNTIANFLSILFNLKKNKCKNKIKLKKR
jgi:hypothetical protein